MARAGFLGQFGLDLGANWCPAPALCCILAEGLVRTGGPRRLSSTILLGSWRGVVARTGSLFLFGWGLVAGWWSVTAF